MPDNNDRNVSPSSQPEDASQARRPEANEKAAEGRETRRFDTGDPEVTSVDGNLDDPQRFPGVEDNPLGFVRVDTNKEDDQTQDRSNQLPGEDLNPDFITVGTDPEAVMDEISKYTDDEEVLADFAERQEIAYSSDELLNRLREHHALSPNLSGDDIDAAWEKSDVSGEESVGGTAPTPDQDIVEELGEALGINYADNEPLQTGGKLNQRDLNRWELDPASADAVDDEDETDVLYAALQGATLDAGAGGAVDDLLDEVSLEEILQKEEGEDVDEDDRIDKADVRDRTRDAYEDDDDLDLDEESILDDEDVEDLWVDDEDEDDDLGDDEDDLDDLDDLD